MSIWGRHLNDVKFWETLSKNISPHFSSLQFHDSSHSSMSYFLLKQREQMFSIKGTAKFNMQPSCFIWERWSEEVNCSVCAVTNKTQRLA